MRGFFRGTLRKLALLLGLLTLVSLAWPIFKDKFFNDDRARIMAVLKRLKLALEQQDLQEFMSLVSPSYQDGWGDKLPAELEDRLAAFFKAYPILEVAYEIDRSQASRGFLFNVSEKQTAETGEGATKVRVFMTLTLNGGKEKGGKANESLTGQLGGGKLVVQLNKDDDSGSWFVSAAARPEQFGYGAAK